MTGQLQLIAGAIALLSVLSFLFWFWKKAEQSGYAKGVSDEIKNSDKKMADLARKLYGSDDTRFGVPDLQAWGAPAKPDAGQAGVVSDRDTTGLRSAGDGAMPDNKGKGDAV
jgi:hypothetical protein